VKPLLDLVARHKAGQAVGMYSVCSAHPLVLEAALRVAKRRGAYALIEATSNQVNQDGGYTGMRPAEFAQFVRAMASRVGLPRQRLLLGGDHLGPNCWQGLSAEQALLRSERLVGDYVAAGFRKIHVDCSMACADDRAPLGDAIVAERVARLCQVAERSWQRAGGAAPVYVVGTEVPVPGGAQESLTELRPTEPAAAAATLEAHRRAFADAQLGEVWPRVIGLVVQPGVEFDHHKVIDFQPERIGALAALIGAEPHMVYEAHSTDYQAPANLRALVSRHFALLKVGPALTFALREVLWSLAMLEREWPAVEHPSQLRETVLAAMAADPRHWEKYYLSSGAQLAFDQQFSLSDRVRYYWPVAAVEQALERLLSNLEQHPPPPTLLSQFLPQQYAALRAGALAPSARELVLYHVESVIEQYALACGDATA
jgi:D-tagatose-1,6-bisphosphate aldolase subunit GatZ/KbaZ